MKRAIVEYRGLYYDKAPAGVWLFHENKDIEFLFYDGNDQEQANEMLINAASEDALLEYLIEHSDTIVRERVEVPVTNEDTIESLYKRFINDKEIPQPIGMETK
jgi:hypothetical protein